MAALGDTLDLVVGAVTKTLTRINGPWNGQSEYLLKESLGSYRAKVRHSKSGGKNGAPLYDRHNFEVVQTIYATETVPEYYRKFYIVSELLPTDEDVSLGDAVADLCIANSNELLDELNDWKA